MFDLPKPMQDTLKIHAICSDLGVSEDDTEFYIRMYTILCSVDPEHERGEDVFEDPNTRRITEAILQAFGHGPIDALTQGVRKLARGLGYENVLRVQDEQMRRMFTDLQYRAEKYRFFRDKILSKMDDYDMDDVMDAAERAELREEEEIQGLEDSL